MECFQDCPNLQYLSCLHSNLYVFFVFFLCVHPMLRLMIKRAQGRNRLGRKNFKKRYFCLTNQYLSYAKSKGWAEEERRRKMWYFFPSPVLFLIQCSVFVQSVFVLIQFVKCSCPLFTWLCYALQSDVLISLLSLLPVCFPSKMSCLLIIIIVGSWSVLSQMSPGHIRTHNINK